ncbi:MAG: FAD-dependent oxidoreductase [Thermodesulfobacteriota bacterium]|nr:FAD-dependent oxidoreductase [Thermodesulfobacteriota bacterium]
MSAVSFSSWNGKIVDNRKGKVSKAAKSVDIKLPAQLGDNVSAVMGWSGLVVMDPDADIISLTVNYLKEARKLSCGECSVCRIGIDRLLDIFGKMAEGDGSGKELSEVQQIVGGVSENSKCNYGQSVLFPVLDAVKYYKTDFQALVKGEKKLETKKYSSAVTAPCTEACPASLDIPGYIELIKNFRFGESLDLIREKCILPGVIGRVCTRPCEDACVRNDIDESLSIRLLKRAAADYDLQECASSLAVPAEEKEEKIAIIGGGPAGLAAAYHLRSMGYQVTIFESFPRAGGMAAVGIPDYRLPQDILNHEIDLIKRMGVEIKLNTKIEKLDLKDLQKQGYKATFIAIGSHLGTKIGAEGEDEGYEGFVDGVEFLRDMNLGEKVEPKKKVAIVGGGNTALDCARSCFRLGFDDVEIIYRRSRAEMPADDVEIEEAEQEGIKINFLMTPVKILAEDGKVTGVECIKMKLGEPDESGRRRPVPVKGSEFVMNVDMVIPAIGQKTELFAVAGKDEFELTDWGTFDVDPVSYMTNVEGVFAGGDCATGPAILIDALNAGNKVARSIDCYLRGESLSEEVSFEGVDLKERGEPGFRASKAAEKVDLMDVSKRAGSFAEVESGYDVSEAMYEAERCLRCYRLVVWE